MIETYWNEVFGQFKESDGKFTIPGFPEPLMSVHFGVKNIIGPTDREVKQTFKICTFGPLLIKESEGPHYETLNKAIESSEFWNFQKQYTNTYDFMQRLLPFLDSLSTPHFHFYLKGDEGITASALVGVANSGCFLFNLSVSPAMRNKGQANLIFHQIRSSFYDKKAFYWTVHPWFTFDSITEDYHLID